MAREEREREKRMERVRPDVGVDEGSKETC